MYSWNIEFDNQEKSLIYMNIYPEMDAKVILYETVYYQLKFIDMQ